MRGGNVLDAVLLAAFCALPVTMWVLTRSLVWVGTRVALAFGLAGTGVQATISLGWHWDLPRLQWLVLALMVGLTVWAAFQRGIGTRTTRRQLIVIVAPMVVIGLFLIAMRMMAPGSPGPLSGFGYFINHPLAEDNAKWLHLSSQLADGRDLVFNGYAGGPLILVMVVMATVISVLSMALLGGVNEVAVALHAVTGTQFLLIALVPMGFAPFAEGRLPRPPRTGRELARSVPAPLVWVAMAAVVLASAVVTSYGHLSLQFVLIILVLWASVFLVGSRVPRARLTMTLVIATTASVWLPLNVLGLGLLAAGLVACAKRRDWWGLGLVAITVIAVWDALISSTLYLLGIDLAPVSNPDSASTSSGSDSNVAQDPTGEAAQQAASWMDSNAVTSATSLFQAPGGTEIVQPLLGGVAIAALLMAVAWYSRTRRVAGLRAAEPFLPIVIMAGYLLCLTLADAVITGGSPHYGVHKMAFAVTIMVIAATLPVAIMALESAASGMTMLRWFAIGGVVVLLTLDSILPRALSALSPVLWPSVDASNPAYWSGAEVRRTAEQPIGSLPVACLFAPPEVAVPGGLPEGQQSYHCTRLLVGLNGMEGRAGLLTSWLLTDWLSNASQWDGIHGALAADEGDLIGRSVILTKPDGSLAGLTTLGALLDRYPPSD